MMDSNARRKHRDENRGIIALIALICCLFLGVTGLLFYMFREPDVLQGTWRYDEHTTYEFDGKRRGCMDLTTIRVEFTYKVKKDVVILNFADDNLSDCVYEFHVNGDELTLEGGEGTSGGIYKLHKE